MQNCSFSNSRTRSVSAVLTKLLSPISQEPWSDVPTSDPESAEAGRAHLRMPPLLRSALDTALYPGSESGPSAHQPPQSLDTALFSESESVPSVHQPRHSPYINITETPQGEW